MSFKYLGIQVGGNPRKREFWKEVLDKVRKKLSKWKGKNLIFAGRVWLFKSVFHSCNCTTCTSLKHQHWYVKDLTSLKKEIFVELGQQEKKDCMGKMGKHM